MPLVDRQTCLDSVFKDSNFLYGEFIKNQGWDERFWEVLLALTQYYLLCYHTDSVFGACKLIKSWSVMVVQTLVLTYKDGCVEIVINVKKNYLSTHCVMRTKTEPPKSYYVSLAKNISSRS